MSVSPEKRQKDIKQNQLPRNQSNPCKEKGTEKVSSSSSSSSASEGVADNFITSQIVHSQTQWRRQRQLLVLNTPLTIFSLSH